MKPHDLYNPFVTKFIKTKFDFQLWDVEQHTQGTQETS